MKSKNLNHAIYMLVAMLTFLSTTVKISAQQYQNVTIYTPENNAVTAMNLVSSDFTTGEKNDLKNYWLSYYDNRIEYIAEATLKYNCHAYAWHISE
jgi:hypothetical protein